MNGERRKRVRRRPWRSLVMLSVAAISCVIALVAALSARTASVAQESRGDHRLRYQYEGVVEVDGVRYRPRKRLTAILLLGVDRASDEADRPGVFNGGMADFQRLIVVDDERRQISQIQIDRDAMTPVTILGPLGDEIGQAVRQICVAYSYGDGGEKSCEYAVKAASGLLWGAPIDHCVSLKMDGISALNALAGGVTVTLEDDFTEIAPSMRKGATVTLRDAQAEAFVRGRRNVGEGTNEARMRRQQQFIDGLFAGLSERFNADKGYIGEAYDALSDYMVTDMSRGLAINEVWKARSYDSAGVIELPGTRAVNEKNNMEFVADEEAVQDIILALFYEPLL